VLTVEEGGRRQVASDGGTIVPTLSPSGHLYLTKAEADRLAGQLRQELVCRTTGQVADPVTVADVPLTVAEAWRLLDRLDTSNDEAVDWLKDGFFETAL
jgi:hypothetical protein